MVKKRVQIFEEQEPELETDNEEIEVPPKTEKEPKIDKRRRKRTPEEIERLKNQLAKGRAKSQATRAKLNQMKKLDREEKITKSETELYEKLKNKKDKQEDKNNLLEEIAQLKMELKKGNKVAPEPEPEPKKQPEPEPEPKRPPPSAPINIPKPVNIYKLMKGF